jgi:cephalosporin hydroxylase
LTLLEDYEARAGAYSDIQDCLEFLYRTAVAYPQVAVLELGVRSGNSTAAFLAAAEEAGGHVWSVDIAEPQVPDRWRTSGYWSLTVADDLTAAPGASQTAVPDFADVLFVDTSHAYEQTLAELRRFVPLVSPGGTVLLHDTRLETVEGAGPQPPFPVARALDLFCAETGRSWLDRDAQYGLGEILRPNG